MFAFILKRQQRKANNNLQGNNASRATARSHVPWQ